MSIPTILERSIGKIRFCVDEVDRATILLATQSAKSQLEQRLVRAASLEENREFLAFSHDATLLECCDLVREK